MCVFSFLANIYLSIYLSISFSIYLSIYFSIYHGTDVANIRCTSILQLAITRRHRPPRRRATVARAQRRRPASSKDADQARYGLARRD